MADLPLSRLTDDEQALVTRLMRRYHRQQRHLELLEKYRDAAQIIEHIGIATPPELRRFEASVNVPGMAVREHVNRQELRAFVRTGDGERPDPALLEGWEFNNLASQSHLCHTEARTYGRGFVTVHSNAGDVDHPLITVESTRSIALDVDRQRRRMNGAIRVMRSDSGRQSATLYLPNSTIWLDREGDWRVADRDDHGFGKIPMVQFINDPVAGKFGGRSIMADVIKKVDAITRTLTNMQIGAERAAIPDNVIFGLAQEDLRDADGKPVAPWEAYWTKLKIIANEKGHIDQIPAANLTNFTDMVDRLMVYCAVELGLPTRYAGMDTANPASEGAIVADEFRLVKRVENINRLDGDSWSWVMGLYEEFRTGQPVQGNRIRALWHDPATPTYSQRVDGVLKLRTTGLLSIQGAWDELGWSEERKARELQYMQSEQDDPLVQMARDLASPSGAAEPTDGAESTDGDSDDLKKKFDALGTAIRAGVSPEDAARRLGLDGIAFTGAVPVSLRVPETQANTLES